MAATRVRQDEPESDDQGQKYNTPLTQKPILLIDGIDSANTFQTSPCSSTYESTLVFDDNIKIIEVDCEYTDEQITELWFTKTEYDEFLQACDEDAQKCDANEKELRVAKLKKEIRKQRRQRRRDERRRQSNGVANDDELIDLDMDDDITDDSLTGDTSKGSSSEANKKDDDGSLCPLGLEAWTLEGYQTREHNRQKAMDAVLNEQYTAWDRGVVENKEMMSALYFAATATSKHAAVNNGKQLEEDVKEHMVVSTLEDYNRAVHTLNVLQKSLYSIKSRNDKLKPKMNRRGSNESDKMKGKESNESAKMNRRGSNESAKMNRRGSNESTKMNRRGSNESTKMNRRGSNESVKESANETGKMNRRGSNESANETGKMSRRGSNEIGKMSRRGSNETGKMSRRGSNESPKTSHKSSRRGSLDRGKKNKTLSNENSSSVDRTMAVTDSAYDTAPRLPLNVLSDGECALKSGTSELPPNASSTMAHKKFKPRGSKTSGTSQKIYKSKQSMDILVSPPTPPVVKARRVTYNPGAPKPDNLELPISTKTSSKSRKVSHKSTADLSPPLVDLSKSDKNPKATKLTESKNKDKRALHQQPTKETERGRGRSPGPMRKNISMVDYTGKANPMGDYPEEGNPPDAGTTRKEGNPPDAPGITRREENPPSVPGMAEAEVSPRGT
eukprot:CAMPEP_0197198860 /NCGR_PEP_ID=MMETSP1423-20130617/33589_1 /TAXON_ID=476441 /ORGANISM="Pseudo-nitzschia heimii, Strain UNC1101" /LENGTH=672 /DNA_ID=CAMNT_0042652701 /DNA_START=20 /DNA_END=2039 /DNA_ORIENTATION=+